MTVHILIRHPHSPGGLSEKLRRIARILLCSCKVEENNVNIVITDDEEMSELNEQYRTRRGPTNVLSFPFKDGIDPTLEPLAFNELGDIVISLDTALREAAEYGQSLKHRLSWLMTHGLLHLLGYDHEVSDAHAEQMYAREQQLLDELFQQRRKQMPTLAINVDHVATIRQARGISEPDPITAAALCELAGAKGIVVHLREDRRHIQDRDVRILRETVQTKLNLEMGAARDIIAFALDIGPDMITLVPEKRQELTTEGGLNVVSQKKKIAKVIAKMTKAGIPVSLFIDPSEDQVKASHDIGATFVEIHTGAYAEASDTFKRQEEFLLIENAAAAAHHYGLRVNAGHGLNYLNTAAIAAIQNIEELSIGHAVISRAVFSGLEQAVREMDAIIRNASSF